MKAEQHKDLRVELRVKNNVLFKAIMANHESVAAFCRTKNLTGVEYIKVCKLLSFHSSPVDEKGVWKPIAYKIAALLKGKLEELFPLYLYEKIKEPKRVLEISSFTALPGAVRQVVAQLPAPDEPVEARLERADEFESVAKFFNRLTYRERESLKMHYGIDCPAMNFVEIGQAFGVSRERARGIVHRAEEKLRKFTGSKAGAT